MCENINQTYLNLPQNADKVLFAQDLVNYSLRMFMFPSLPTTIERYRTVIHNAFNPIVSVAVNYLYTLLENENLEEFENIRIHQTLDRNSFIKYVTSIEIEYLSGGFDAQKFLHFCVKTTSMSIRFYRNGFNVGPALAVQRIVNALGNFDMSSGGWETVNNIAANYARICVNIHNPNGTESDYESTSSSGSGEFSEASDSVMTPSEANGSKRVDGRKYSGLSSDSHESSEEEYSDSSSSECCHGSSVDMTSTGEPCEQDGNKIQSSVFCLTLEDIFFNTTSAVQCIPLTPSKNEAKPGGDVRGSSSSNSVYFNTDEEWESNVFEDSLEVKKTYDNYGRQLARKRSASSSSTTSGLHVQDSAEKSDAHLSFSASDSVCHEGSSLQEPICSVETSNDAVSPVRKHIAKFRKHF